MHLLSKLKILVHGINYSPELTGIGKYSGEMAAWLASNGHNVEVITAPPYYPQWKISSPYKNFWKIEKSENLLVMRGPLYVPKRVTSIKRIIHESSFTLSTLIFWFRVIFIKYDVVLVICPVLQSGMIPSLLRYFKKFKFVVHVQDLQIDAAKQLNMVKSGFLISILEKVEKFIFNRADLVSTISEGMSSKIKGKGIDQQKLVVFKNWVETETIFPLTSIEKLDLRAKYGYAEKDFIILYSGNMGEKQGLEMILEAAKEFKNQNHVKFLIVGNGASKASLVEKASKMSLDNIRFMDLVPISELNRLLNLPNLHLVLQKKGATDLVMPSKLGGIMAAGGFVLVSTEVKSDLYEIISTNQLGLCVLPEDLSGLIGGISSAMLQDSKNFSSRARDYAIHSLSQDQILNRFVEVLTRTI